MKVNYFSPEKKYKWLINQMEAIHSDGEMNVTDRHIPRGDSSFVFNFTGQVTILRHKELVVPPFFIAPILYHSILLRVDNNISSLIVSCKSPVLSKIFGISMYPPTSNLYIPLNDRFMPVWAQMQQQPDDGKKIDTFYRFLDSETRGDYQPDEIDTVYNNIIDHGATTPLCEILKPITTSERNFRRQFVKRVGINTKTLTRIVRVNYLWDKIKNQNAIDFQNLVFEGHYFDQAHFIKDFKSIVGEAPHFFFKRNLENVKIISGKL
jgi:hypothetical protein